MLGERLVQIILMLTFRIKFNKPHCFYRVLFNNISEQNQCHLLTLRRIGVRDAPEFLVEESLQS